MIEAAAAEPLAPNHKQDVEVPESLMPADRLAAAMAANPPAWSGQGPQPALDPETGVHMKRLANGIRVNYKVSRAESHRGSMGLKVPGGRMLEDKLKPGSVAVGTRTMQEGGALGPWSREQVRLTHTHAQDGHGGEQLVMCVCLWWLCRWSCSAWTT